MSQAAVTILAISRQKGSGGGHIGRVIAERRKLRYIDGPMLRDAAEYLRVHDPNLERVGERMDTWWSTMAGALAMGGLSGLGMLPVDTVREADTAHIERRIIQEIAQQHPSVIVGRGAGHVLKGRPGVLNVLVHAPEAWRIERVAQHTGVTAAKAKDAVKESDRQRASFVRTLTGTDWTDARQYDLAIDTSTLGIDQATEMILQIIPAASRA